MNYAVLGAGKMGSALVRGMLASGLTTGDRVIVSSSTRESAEQTASSLGVKPAGSNAEAIRDAEIIFLCVKPRQATAVLSSIASELEGKLLISIIAGIRSEDLFQAANGKVRVIRSMSSTKEDLEMATAIFSSVGSALVVRESDLDTVTAVSGSGPAFALLMLEAMAQGGIDGGLEPELAKTLAAGALAAAAALVSETGQTPLALRAEITSPAGTTAAGLEVLENEGFSGIVRASIRAARNRSIELSSPPINL